MTKYFTTSMLVLSVMVSMSYAGSKPPTFKCKDNLCTMHLKDMYLSYQPQENKRVNFTISAKTTGWVAVGFGVNNTMSNAVMVIGYVDKNGKTHLSQEYGVKGSPPHKPIIELGGTPEVKLISGSVEKGQTTISFSMPLVPKAQKYNFTFTKGEDIPIIMAYGKNGAKNKDSYHQYRTSAIIKNFE